MGELKCCVVQDLLAAFLDGKVQPETDREITYHLASCAACRKLAVDLKPSWELPKDLEKPAQGGEEGRTELKATRRRSSALTLGVILIIFSLVVVSGLGVFEFFKVSDIPVWLKAVFAAALLGTGIILTVLIVERIREQRSEKDDFGKY